MKLLGQCSLIHRVVRTPRGHVYDCQPQGGRELGWDDKANTCEPLINVVRFNKPKGLRGLDQKVGGQVEEFLIPLPQMLLHRRTGGA
jgi:hypothetical protein